MFYADGDVASSCENISIINRNTEALIDTIMLVDLVIYSEKT
jgi:hypothetical protein